LIGVLVKEIQILKEKVKKLEIGSWLLYSLI
jgi:hypothetical protein